MTKGLALRITRKHFPEERDADAARKDIVRIFYGPTFVMRIDSLEQPYRVSRAVYERAETFLDQPDVGVRIDFPVEEVAPGTLQYRLFE